MYKTSCNILKPNSEDSDVHWMDCDSFFVFFFQNKRHNQKLKGFEDTFGFRDVDKNHEIISTLNEKIFSIFNCETPKIFGLIFYVY